MRRRMNGIWEMKEQGLAPRDVGGQSLLFVRPAGRKELGEGSYGAAVGAAIGNAAAANID